MTEKNRVMFSKEIEYVDAKVTVMDLPFRDTSTPERQREPFTSKVFEGALDKVSRPTSRGKYADLRPNSEEFARRKQEEIDLEERRR